MTRMKTRAAVIFEMQRPRPYALSQPLSIEELDLDGPGDGEVLVRIRAAGLLHSIEKRFSMCGLIWLPRPSTNLPFE